MLYYVIRINMPNCFLFLQQWSLKTQVTSVWSPSSCPEDSVQSSVTNEGRTPVINLYYEHDGKSTTSEELAFSSEWSANATTKKALAQLSPSQACSLPLSISALGVHSAKRSNTGNQAYKKPTQKWKNFWKWNWIYEDFTPSDFEFDAAVKWINFYLFIYRVVLW